MDGPLLTGFSVLITLALLVGCPLSAQLSMEATLHGGTRIGSATPLTLDAESHIVTDVGGTFAGSLVNDLVGADRFYAAGYDGSGTISSNIEAGHVWGTSSGHDSLNHVTQFVHDANAAGEFDRHATWVGHAIGGRPGNDEVSTGIAPGTDLRSGAIATEWSEDPNNYNTSFSINSSTFYTAYSSDSIGFGAADVINSSWGLSDSTGTDFFTVQMDGLAADNPASTVVISAGNTGPGTNTVGGAASGYNSIAVGALENNGSDVYDRVADFSSRGPQDYADTNGTVTGVRAPVDIAAPGTNLTLAYYGGATGGNAGGTNDLRTNLYSGDMQGTSFSAPIAAGGIALMHHAADGEGLPASARDSRVIRSTLMNAADKVLHTDGSAWDNGQVANGGTITTSQALDYESGAGGLNLTRTYDQYISGQTDIAGTSGGTSYEHIGWDFAEVAGTLGSSADIVLPSIFGGGTMFRSTLTWFRDRTSIDQTTASDDAFADLNLEVWDSTFSTLYAESVSDYNSAEHLYFELSDHTTLGLRVTLDEMRFGSQDTVPFALSWYGVVPEPNSLVLVLVALAGIVHRRTRR